jgi:hypothetical protein
VRVWRATAFARARAALLLFGVVAVVAAGGCRLPENALDAPLAVPLRITATAETIKVDAPNWYAAETSLYLCPMEPPSLPEPGPSRASWTPGGSCHDFGRFGAADGLQATLPLEALTEAERIALNAVDDWYLLVVKVEAGRATAAIQSSFASPIRAAN